MNSKTSIKIALDFLMTILFLGLLDAHSTGLVFHEIAGLSLIALISAHFLLNWSWVKTFAKNLFNPRFKMKPKLMYILNIGLLLGISLITITGILISQVIFPSGSAGNTALLVTIHEWISYFCLGLIAMHILLHRKYIFSSIRNMFAHGKREILPALATMLVIGVLFTQITLGADDKELTSAAAPPAITSRNSANPQTKDDQTNTTLQETEENGKTISLSDFLGNMFCTGCSKHCSLLNLRCDKGEAQLQAAKTEYQNLYGQTASETTAEGLQESTQNPQITPKNSEVNEQTENNYFFRDEKPSKDRRHRNQKSHGSDFQHM